MPKVNRRREEVRVASNLFVTSNINFAAYLKASGRLRFDHVEVRAKFSEFYFCDPAGVGPSIFKEFLESDPSVSANGILEARSALLVAIQRGRL